MATAIASDESLAESRATAARHQIFSVDPSVRAHKRENRLVGILRTAALVVLLGSWELASGRLLSEFWISSPSAVARTLVDLAVPGHLWSAVGATLQTTVVGFLVGAAIGILMGVLFGLSRVLARAADPYLVAINSLPRVAIIPLLILWFGIGFQTRMVFTALLVFFPVMTNTLSGIREVDRDLIDVLKVMGASQSAIIRKVLVPAALVWVFAGLRISVPFALIGAVIAEMFTANVGLGYLISASANNFNTAGVFAALFVTTAIGVILTTGIGTLERRILRWQPETS